MRQLRWLSFPWWLFSMSYNQSAQRSFFHVAASQDHVWYCWFRLRPHWKSHLLQIRLRLVILVIAASAAEQRANALVASLSSLTSVFTVLFGNVNLGSSSDSIRTGLDRAKCWSKDVLDQRETGVLWKLLSSVIPGERDQSKTLSTFFAVIAN